MRLLLDTHIFLWFLEDNIAMSAMAKSLIEDSGNDLLLSAAGLWEMAIKVSTGKLRLSNRAGQTQPFHPFVADQLRLSNIGMLPIELPHIVRAAQLPYHHRDPFDQMLAAQSLVEQTPLLSADAVFYHYGVNRIW